MRVRAILDEEVSVEVGRRRAAQLVELCSSGATRTFPQPAQLVAADLRGMNLPNARKRALTELAKAALADPRLFESLGSVDATDAFPATDVVLLRSAAQHARLGLHSSKNAPNVGVHGAPTLHNICGPPIMPHRGDRDDRQVQDLPPTARRAWPPAAGKLLGCWERARAGTPRAPAVATTSAGLAWSNGYPDGDALPVELLVASVRAIARVLTVPLTVDLEGGYSSDPAKVAETVAALLDAGVVGINLEDGSAPPDLLAAKIERVKERAARAGADVFVNARTDVYLRGLVAEPARVQESVARGTRYRSAGADGLFVPKAIVPADLAAIAASVALPLNVLAWPQLRRLRSSRRSACAGSRAAPALAQLAYGRAAAAAGPFLAEGRTDHLTEGALPFADANKLFHAADLRRAPPTAHD